MSPAARIGLTRRDALRGAASAAALLLASSKIAAGSGGVSADDAIAKLLAGRQAAPSGRLRLEVPAAFDYGNTIPLGIAVDSPMTAADHVRRVDIFADGNPVPEIASLYFQPDNGPARLSTRFRLDKGSHLIRAFAQMSDGTVIAASGEVSAASSGCAGSSGLEANEPDLLPLPRVNVPERAGQGEILDVPSMITHRMETGFRTDKAGNLLPRRIIHRMECHYGGRRVFAADLSPAIAANAYLKFPLLAVNSGEVTFAWFEDGGAVHRTVRRIAVT